MSTVLSHPAPDQVLEQPQSTNTETKTRVWHCAVTGKQWLLLQRHPELKNKGGIPGDHKGHVHGAEEVAS